MTTQQTNDDKDGLRDSFQRRPSRFMTRIERAKNPRSALRRLLPFLTHFKFSLILIIAFVLIYTVLDLIGPYLMGVAIDGFIAAKDSEGLIRIALLLLTVYILNNLFQALAGWTTARMSQQVLKRLRRDLFRHLQTLPLSFFDHISSGDLMSRLTNDIDAISQSVSQNVTGLFASVLSMSGIVVAMFVLDWRLAFVSLFVVPIMLWFARFVATYTRKAFGDLQKHLGDLNGVMEEAISGQKVVKAFQKSESVIASFRLHNQEVFRNGVYANTYALLLMPLTNVLGNFFVIGVSGFGGWLALQNLASVGIIATFISYAQNFIHPLRQLAGLYNTIQASLAGAERVFEIIDTKPELHDSPDALSLESISGNVRFENVSFGYQSDVPVIRSMSLEGKTGEIIALVGPTGAGKTTIINLLSRFYEINEGTITVDGHDIRKVKKAELRRKLGIVLQDTFLFSDTVMENIRYGRLNASDEEVIVASKLAEADHFIHLLPQGYQTLLSERASNLSQGQRQLLAIARAILADPCILILDEATSSVDTRTEARIQKALLRLMKGRTSFVIAHRLSTIRDANKVLVINQGEIIEQGTHQQLLDLRGFYRKLYISQFKGQEI
ncbi:MAG: ABC transporter ATP-binding protein [Candidatus Riflebacteria bacterium]|nr:ABC transporter ATP-binding protein [Candidatus Riflebacteria bacterium]